MGDTTELEDQVAVRTIYYAVKKEKQRVGIFHRWEEFQNEVFDQVDMHIRTFGSLDAAWEWYRKPCTESVSRKRKRSTSRSPNGRARSLVRRVEVARVTAGGINLESPGDVHLAEMQVISTPTPSEPPHPVNQTLTDTSPSVNSLHSVAPADGPADSLVPGPRSEDIALSPEQEMVLNKVKAGHSMFFTGSAGTGKSFLLRRIVQWARKAYGDDAIAVTASTGLAAINIGGCTIYSWAGIKLGKEEPAVLWKIIVNASYETDPKTGRRYLLPDSPLQRWQDCEILILDEVSMIDGKLIDKLDFIGRRANNADEPWGGIQVIYCGDFFQLPPVTETENTVRIPPTLAFESESWPQTVGKPIILKRVFRQTDSELIDMLNALRVGELNQRHIHCFSKELARPIVCPEGIEPIELYPLKARVNDANNKRLAQLKGRAECFKSEDKPGFTKDGIPLPREIFQAALKRMVALESITLKVGAQVMLIKNLVPGMLVNGSLGRVIGFKLARDAFKEGVGFALQQSLRVLISGVKQQQDFPDRLSNDDTYWPLVQFAKCGMPLLCVPTDFEAVSASGRAEAIRWQIPLIPAWAMSIHKSQGMSIDYLKVDLARSFEYGQVYVALSRATSIEGLQVCNFDPLGVKTHPRVITWMRDAERR